jgi:hypothetical protein
MDLHWFLLAEPSLLQGSGRAGRDAHHPAVSDQLGAQQLLPIDLPATVGSHEGPPLPDVGNLHKGGQAPRPGFAQPNGAARGILGVDLEGNPGLVVDTHADTPRPPVELRPDQQQDPTAVRMQVTTTMAPSPGPASVEGRPNRKLIAGSFPIASAIWYRPRLPPLLPPKRPGAVATACR